MDFEGAAVAFLGNSTLQEIWGYRMPGKPPDAYHYLINQTACEEFIGTGRAWYSWDDASNTINTWILPFTGLLLQAPFDSNDPIGTFWVIMRWTGGCVASLSYILWNMRTTANCAAFVDRATNRTDFPPDFETDEQGEQQQSDFSSMRDSFFLLGVMNQFSLNVRYNGISAEKLIKVALFSKDLRLRAADSNIIHVRRALARDTREARKRGTVQCFLSMLWFIFGLVISIQQAFGLLGQDAAAHDLALGLTMIWFPVLILCSTVDRNPAVPEATQRQLNIFMGMVRDALMRDASSFSRTALPGSDGTADENHLPRLRVNSFDTVVTGSIVKMPIDTVLLRRDASSQSSEDSNENKNSDNGDSQNWFRSAENDLSDNLSWLSAISSPEFDEIDFFTEFAGQGRKLWHYGVAHPILQGLKRDGAMQYTRGWLYEPDARARLIRTARDAPSSALTTEKQEQIRQQQQQAKNPSLLSGDRLHSFDMREVWQLCMSFFTVWGSCMSAFVLSYFTPTVGLGCRALGYIVFSVQGSGMLIAEMFIWWMTPHGNYGDYENEGEAKSSIRYGYQTKSYERWRFWGLWSIRIGEVINLVWLMYILFAQILGSYNTCRCKCSNYGVGGGFIDMRSVANPDSNRAAAMPYWIAGTAMGCAIMCLCFGFIAWEWVTQSHLSSEDYNKAMRGLRTTRSWKKWTRWLLPLQA